MLHELRGMLDRPAGGCTLKAGNLGCITEPSLLQCHRTAQKPPPAPSGAALSTSSAEVPPSSRSLSSSPSLPDSGTHRLCGTPGCHLPDHHDGSCEPVRSSARKHGAKERFDPSPARPRPRKVPRRSLDLPPPTAPPPPSPSTAEHTFSQLVALRKALHSQAPGRPAAASGPEGWTVKWVPRHVQCPDAPRGDIYFLPPGGGDTIDSMKGLKAHLIAAGQAAPPPPPPPPPAATPSVPSTPKEILPATWAFVAACPSVEGRGLFARAPLVAGQAVCEYGGPRLPTTMQRAGDRGSMYALALPRTRIIVDGNGDSLPGAYSLPRFAAIFANHSSRPNAALEFWPDLLVKRSGSIGQYSFEMSGAMWIVATEAIAAGEEIRINYEGGEGRGAYWTGGAPEETGNWRDLRAPLPAGFPTLPEATPAIGVLDAIRAANSRGKRPSLPAALVRSLAHIYPAPAVPLPEEEAEARIRLLAPLLARSDNRKTWGLLATHLPGWSGRRCFERWVGAMGRQPPLQDQQEEEQRRARRSQHSAILATMR